MRDTIRRMKVEGAILLAMTCSGPGLLVLGLLYDQTKKRAWEQDHMIMEQIMCHHGTHEESQERFGGKGSLSGPAEKKNDDDDDDDEFLWY